MTTVNQLNRQALEADLLRGLFPTREAVDNTPWPAPDELGDDDRAPLPVFPADALPGDVGKYVQAAATYHQIPVDIAALVVLGCLSAIVGGYATVTGHWTEHTLNLYLAPLADSGEGKSPLVSMIAASVRALERQLRNAYDKEHGDRAEAHEIACKTRDRLVAKIADASGPRRDAFLAELDTIKQEIADTRPPSRPQLTAGDVTPEVLGRIMARTGGHIAMISAEGGFLGTLAGRYTRGVANIDLVLTAYDATEPYRVERITRDGQGFEILRPSLALTLCVQPVVVAEAVEAKALRDRGLPQRFLYARPESLAGGRDKTPPKVPDHLAATWHNCIHGAYYTLLPDGKPHGDDGEPKPPVPMQISPQAEQLHLAWRTGLEQRVDPDAGDLAPIKGWVKKLEGTAYRLAGLLHLAASHDPRRPVSDATMRDALRIADWAIPHAKAVLVPVGEQTNAGQAELNHVRSWIRRKAAAEFTIQTVRVGLRGRTWVRRGGADAVRDALLDLTRQGWLTTVERLDSQGRRVADGVFVAHPSLLGEPQ